MSIRPHDPPIITSALTEIEQAAKRKAEQAIEQGLTSFVDVGQALAAVRDQRLYRDEYGTFEEYTEKRWNLTRRRAYQLLDAAKVTAELTENNCSLLPATESQARELSGLDPDAAADVMRKAHADTDGRVTAKAIKQARDMTTLADAVAPPSLPAPKADGRRQGKYGPRSKHLPVLDRLTASLDGLVMAATGITALDSSVTAEEADRLTVDLSRQIKALQDLNKLLKERTK